MTTAITTATIAPATDADVEKNVGLARWHVKRFIATHPHYARHRDDLTSEAMLALVVARDEFDPGVGLTFRQFARLKVKNAILMESRRRLQQKRRGDFDSVAMPRDTAAPVADAAHEIEARELVSECLDSLDGAERDAVESINLAGLTFRQYARRAGLTVSQVQDVMDRAFRKMRATTAAKGGEQ